MEKPNLSRTWETFIKIPSDGNMTHAILMRNLHDIIRTKIHPMILNLKSKNGLKWYCYLIHGSRKRGDTNLYFHIRFELEEDIDKKETVNSMLPDYCEKDMTARFTDVEENPQRISGVDESLLKNQKIEEAWRILGEQSEWFTDLLNAHREDAEITDKQVGQFLHFYFNMSQLLFMCPCCGNIFHSGKTIVFS